MTELEVGKLLAVAQGAYPEKTAFWNDATKAALAKSWGLVLEEYTYEQGSAALRVYLKSDKFNRFPGVGQIVDIIENLKASAKPEGALTAVQAWEKYVRPAIRDGLYHSTENFEKMPAVVQEAIHSADYLKELAMLPSETIDSVERSNFINRLYKTAVDRRADEARLPVSVRMMVEAKRKESEEAEERRIAAIDQEGNAIEFHREESGDHTAEIEQLQRRLIG